MAPNPLQAQPAAEREVAAIIAFAARYYSGLPFEVLCQLNTRSNKGSGAGVFVTSRWLGRHSQGLGLQH
jgi:hypothetical protein